MAEEEQNNPQSHLLDSTDNTSDSSLNNRLNSASDEIQAEAASEKTNQFCNAQPTIIVNIPQNNDAGLLVEAQKANRYTKRGLTISTMLLLGTLGALAIT